MLDIFAFAVLLSFVLMVFAGFWALWCFVLGTIWPLGPENLISPNFWLFMAMWVLFGVIVKILRGGE